MTKKMRSLFALIVVLMGAMSFNSCSAAILASDNNNNADEQVQASESHTSLVDISPTVAAQEDEEDKEKSRGQELFSDHELRVLLSLIKVLPKQDAVDLLNKKILAAHAKKIKQQGSPTTKYKMLLVLSLAAAAGWYVWDKKKRDTNHQNEKDILKQALAQADLLVVDNIKNYRPDNSVEACYSQFNPALLALKPFTADKGVKNKVQTFFNELMKADRNRSSNVNAWAYGWMGVFDINPNMYKAT